MTTKNKPGDKMNHITLNSINPPFLIPYIHLPLYPYIPITINKKNITLQ